MVNLANNHAFDFGAAGMGRTVRALRRVGVGLTGRPGEIAFVHLRRARIAFLGFAAYRWASPIRDLSAADARWSRGGARQRRRRLHARGAEGSDGSTRPPDERAYGEVRGNPRAFAHAPSTPAPTSCSARPPRAARYRGLQAPADRLLARQPGRLAQLRRPAARSAQRGSCASTLDADGRAAARDASTSLLLDGVGVPHADPARGAERLMRTLSTTDFGRRAIWFQRGTPRP